nr:biotin--[acetyl-CoA-carboxylase] ligase [Halovulum dunhuangense]
MAETDSTNAEAARLLALGTPAPFWVSAAVQTAGRGRRGRPWIAPPGNLTASLALRPGEDAAQAALRSFTASLALAEALEAVGAEPADLSLKWPNDVLLRGRKLAGILLEANRARGGLSLILGIGVNLASAPQAAEIEPQALPPIALAELGLHVAPETLLDHLGPAFAAWETVLRRDGFGPVRDAWLARAARLGQVITARLPGQAITGRFRTVDDTGAVVIETGDGPLALPAADIFF